MNFSRLFSRPFVAIALAIGLCLSFGTAARAFCGFYVAKADADLFNQASQVILARDGDRAVITMSNDYEGDLDEFAMVVPVPVVLQEEQVHVGDRDIIDRLDAFSAPRLVEYFDPDPCAREFELWQGRALNDAAAPSLESSNRRREQVLGVTVEAEFSVGEYDIQILSATESDGLETWLRQNGYRIPDNAQPLLRPYIRQGMKFFVAKVNLEEFERSEFQYLRPLQIAYESPKFMLPIRLGMANASGDQDLIVYALSPQGQVELTNYRTVKVPSNMDIPVFVKSEFDDFYTDMFETAYERENKNVAFLEYAWDIRSCDPCSATPPSAEELRKAGVFWLRPGQSPNAFVTRLHVRYTRDRFPEDLQFQETSNRQNFQGRYVLRHPFGGAANCPAGRQYRRGLGDRFEREAQTLANLTGWAIDDIRAKLPNIPEAAPVRWWEELWGN
ncbi:DUF2330 domain-containing protein [Synechococcus sp. PCC 7336]|uniref:DUF2330 domain-containing protein n=1 Tax=Synechococcus sp. PCC 7336 TaxID=195250 RepID=UPI000348E6EB|nr:DUF2330 domain-containing protein [Synechococcus sp. PCC 7336]